MRLDFRDFGSGAVRGFVPPIRKQACGSFEWISNTGPSAVNDGVNRTLSTL
jgi:hypothetical protein